MEFFNKIGYAVCHQLPERSIFIDGKQLPVCARDTGIYIGSLISLLFILFSRNRKSNAIPLPSISFLFVFFMLLLTVDGVTSYLGLRETTNAIRLATGLLVGISLPLFLYPLLNDNLRVSKKETRIIKSWIELSPILLLVFCSYLLTLSFNSGLHFSISIAIIAGIVLLHYLTITTFLSLFFYDFYPKIKSIKPLIIFSSGFLILVIELITLTKLHNLINR